LHQDYVLGITNVHESDSSIVMLIDDLPDDLDALRALVSSLSSERDAAIEECRRIREQNDRLHHLLRQLQRAQFGRRSEQLDREQRQLALEDIETSLASQVLRSQGIAIERATLAFWAANWIAAPEQAAA
jgi:hypothetical protein